MNILFSVGEMEREVNATTKIVLQLAERLTQKGHSVAVCGVCNAFSRNEEVNGVKVVRMKAVRPIAKASEAFESYVNSSPNRNEARGAFVKKHPLHSAFMFCRYRPEYYKYIEQPRYLKQLKAFAKSFRPDAVVTVCKPILPTRTVSMAHWDCPVYFYQVDPWGLHRIDNPKAGRDIISEEIAVFEKCRAVFTTPILLKQYSEDMDYKKYLGKLHAVDFPNIKEYIPDGAQPAIDFDGEYVNILFCGIITDEFRSPRKVLEGLAPLFEKGEKIRVYFMGTNNSAAVDEYIAKYPDNVFFRESVPQNIAFATMAKADVLFNISNTLDNQVPSKIFDYFSMGKPVLNLQKIQNCPAKEYFDRYPLAFTLNEWQEVNAEKLGEFLYNSKQNHIGFEQVKQIYNTATVEYVAEVMEKEFLK